MISSILALFSSYEGVRKGFAFVPFDAMFLAIAKAMD